MPSPFPGMNPYLEQPGAWHDFHESACPACRDFLVPQVRPTYFVKLDEHVYLHELSAQQRLAGRADVAIGHEPGRPRGTADRETSTTATAYGSVLLTAVDEERLSYIEVRDRKTRELVTVIEILSPSNKDSGSDRSQYLGKRERILNSPAHFVEIDLLRGGRRPPIDGLPECDYYVMVSRAEMRPKVELWPFRLRDPLPKIPIPLRAPDPDAVLDLKAVLDRVYDGAGYEDYIYSGSPVPPLSSEDEPWATGLIAGTGGVEMTPPAS